MPSSAIAIMFCVIVVSWTAVIIAKMIYEVESPDELFEEKLDEVYTRIESQQKSIDELQTKMNAMAIRDGFKLR